MKNCVNLTTKNKETINIKSRYESWHYRLTYFYSNSVGTCCCRVTVWKIRQPVKLWQMAIYPCHTEATHVVASLVSLADGFSFILAEQSVILLYIKQSIKLHCYTKPTSSLQQVTHTRIYTRIYIYPSRIGDHTFTMCSVQPKILNQIII